jgi:hypothetical protein
MKRRKGDEGDGETERLKDSETESNNLLNNLITQKPVKLRADKQKPCFSDFYHFEILKSFCKIVCTFNHLLSI